MKTEVQAPNIVRIAYHQTKGDPHYGSCLWAYFDFDVEKYMLNIQSDCGNAAYRWCATPDTESFLHLMARVDDWYLLEKLFKGDEVDVEATIESVRDWLGISEDEDWKNDSLTDDDVEKRAEALEELKGQLNGCDTAETVGYLLDEWNNENEFDIDCVWELVNTDFTVWEKRIVQIFKDHIQPLVRKLAAEEAKA